MIIKLKEEQKRKLATLAGQYESTIENLLRDLTVKLESWQVILVLVDLLFVRLVKSTIMIYYCSVSGI